MSDFGKVSYIWSMKKILITFLAFVTILNGCTQKEVVETKTTPLIQWYYALVLLILSSAIEWWLRKYNGYT